MKRTFGFGPLKFYAEALAIAIPVMLQSLVTSLVSLVDNFMVSGLGDARMAGVNAANQIIFVYFVLLNTVYIAGGIYLSQHRGAGNRDGMRQAFRFKVLASAASALAMTALALAAPEALIRLMVRGNSAESAIVSHGASYLRAVAASFLPIGISGAFATSFREMGKTRVPLAVSTIAALVNTLLNWLLIYGNAGFPRLEAPGAAIATDIARLVELALFAAIAVKEKPAFSFRIQELFAVDARMFGAILRSSGMMLLSEMTWVFSETVITALYNARGGAQTVAGMSAAWAVANLFFLAFGAVQTATSVTVGPTLGAGDLDEARRRARWIMRGALPFGAMVGALAAATTIAIPLFFPNLSPEARLITRSMLFVISAYLPLWTLLNAQFAVSRAGGDTAMGVWVDVGVTWALFLPAAWILSRYTAAGPVMLFLGAKLTDLVKAAVAEWWLRKERWLRCFTCDEGGGKSVAAPASGS